MAASHGRGLLGAALDPDEVRWLDRIDRPGRTAQSGADPGMVAQPYVDPGYAMTNVDQGNLNQMPDQEVDGWLPASLLRALQALQARSNGS